jgi:hypothetical protein
MSRNTSVAILVGPYRSTILLLLHIPTEYVIIAFRCSKVLHTHIHSLRTGFVIVVDGWEVCNVGNVEEQAIVLTPSTHVHYFTYSSVVSQQLKKGGILFWI